ncbi:DUF4296 domain-containing protein [Tenacibaculum sp. IB213877]|uniref:DUF4296 domain-containing protein n=1 Tax=Tenacibaculum sp. IB213877 TaxID=3097351 RepID=UPI002A5A522B|nr:DUF4296 domain-containing protein [Tenacibaculum sp. IB213877]MDY0780524.1 DUF4296 domain-containing protein [Tenacibaculum sp. IB213877]
MIPKDSMIALLTDMYIASSAKNTKNIYLQRNVNYMAFVYEKYKIDSTRFDASNTYYTSKIQEYNDLISEVKKRLDKKHTFYQLKLDSLDSIKRHEKLKTPLKSDSIKKVVSNSKLKDSIRSFTLDKKLKRPIQKQ